MGNPRSGLDELIKDPKAAGLLKNKEALQRLLDSPDTKRLMEMLNRNAGEHLKSAAGAAAKGDTSQLMGIVQQVMQSKEGAQVIGRISQSVPREKQ